MQKTVEKTSKAHPSAKTQGQGPLVEELFVGMLKDIYWAEKHLTKALPKMKKASTTEELQDAFDDHLAQTEEHVTRLEKAFELMGKKAQAKKCEAMEELTKAPDEMTEETDAGNRT